MASCLSYIDTVGTPWTGVNPSLPVKLTFVDASLTCRSGGSKTHSSRTGVIMFVPSKTGHAPATFLVRVGNVSVVRHQAHIFNAVAIGISYHTRNVVKRLAVARRT